MPLPSNENDLKRRARRRLIGAVALTLLAVIVLPLLLEDEPPPGSSLEVKMLTPLPVDEPIVAVAPALVTEPEVTEPTPVVPEPASSEPEPSKPAVAKPAPKPESPKPAPKPEAKPVAKPVPSPAPPPVKEAKPAATGEAFVVQLAALSNAAKADELKTRASRLGLPAYTDKAGKLTRVRVGPFSTREAAVAAAVRLAEKGMATQVLSQ